MKKRERSKYVNLTEKAGISLIVLIITIIVIIILAAAVILTITKNNPVSSAKESAFKEDVRTFQDDLALTVAKVYTDKQGQRDEKISTSDFNKIKNYIPSFTEKYKGKFIIQDDQLVGTDSLSEKEKMWANDINISTSGKTPFDSEKWDETATNENCFLWAEDGTTITGLDEEKLAGVTKIRIPSKCKAIRSDYANNISEDYRSLINQMVTVEIPDTVTEIGDYAFCNWENLEKITISEGVTSIGKSAFDQCSSLANITIPKSVTSIEVDAFFGCSSLTSIVIPEGVTRIKFGTFLVCSNLESVTIPNSVTDIGVLAFSECNSLTNITIPDSVTSIGSSAFCKCSSLTNITYNGTQSQWNSISKASNWKTDSAIKTITCTDGVIQIN